MSLVDRNTYASPNHVNVLIFMWLFSFADRAIYFKAGLKITRDPTLKKTLALALNDTSGFFFVCFFKCMCLA